MNVTQTFEQNIKELSSTQKKGIENCKKTLHNAIKELNKTMDKYKEGLKTVRSSVDEKLSVGIDGVAKQRKSLLKSTRALEDYVNAAEKELEERFPYNNTDLDEVKLWTYEDFKEWLRNFSKFVNNVDKQRTTTDRIMGLDFAMKKRPAYSQFNKIRELRDTLRELFQTDYAVIKILEDMEIISTEAYELEDKISVKEAEITDLKDKISSNESVIEELKGKINILENEEELRKLRDVKIKFQEHELEIGHIVNPYKKAFRLYTRLPEASGFATSAARSYEDNTIATFLSDSENDYQQLKELINELINKAETIDLKANVVNRLKQLLERINAGKIDKLKANYLSHKENLAKLSENKAVVVKLEELEKHKTTIDSLQQENSKFSETLENEELNLQDLDNQLADRDKRFKDLFEQGINFEFQKA